MSRPALDEIESSADALVRRLDAALRGPDERLVPLAGDGWRRAGRLYGPLLEDLLSRVRRAASQEELEFLARQLDGVLDLRTLDLQHAGETVDPPLHSTLVLEVPLEPLRRRYGQIADWLRVPECREQLSALLDAPVAATSVSPDDLLLRSLAEVLLRGWGAKELLRAPIPARARPAWDLYAADLNVVVGARPRIQPTALAALAPHRLIVSLPAQRRHSHVEVRLASDTAHVHAVLWTGLRWDEEQRLRAAERRRVPSEQLPTAARGLKRTLTRLHRELAQLVANNPPAAPWPWRSRRRSKGGM